MVSLPAWLGALDRKLLRDIWRLRSQAFAIALVIAAGIGMVVMSFGMIRSLEATRDAYYDRYRFADIFASATRFPERLVDDVQSLDGVSIAEGRLTSSATLDVPGIAEPITTRLHSLPRAGMPRVNALVLRSGRRPNPARPDEVLASEKFADAARIGLGDTIELLLYGKKQRLRVVGTALSPEYVYAIGPGQIFPDNRRFGVLWMGEEHLAAALNSTNAYNEVLIRLERGAVSQDVIRRVDNLLARYGGRGATPRSDQISDPAQPDNHDPAANISGRGGLPDQYGAVPAGAIGTRNYRIADRLWISQPSHHVALRQARAGAVLAGIGARTASRFVDGQGAGWPLSGIFCLSVPDLSRGIGCIPDILPDYDHRCPDRCGTDGQADWQADSGGSDAPGIARLIGRIRKLDEPTRIILRGLVRRPLRSLLGSFGVAAALGLYIASAGAMDNVDLMTDLLFNQANRADVNVSFAEPRDERVLFELERLPGVMRVEPVRYVAATLSAGHRSRSESLTGMQPDGDLSRLVDIDHGVVQPPPKGLMLSKLLSSQLAVAPGDLVEVEITEGRRLRLAMPVRSILKSSVGNPAYVDFESLGPIMREAPLASGAYLGVDPDKTDELYRKLKAMPVIAGFSQRAAALNGIDETIRETMGIVTLFNIAFSALIVFGVVYNNARISLAERARDLVSLRVLGYQRSEVSYILLGELALIVVAGLPLGALFGYYLSRYLTASMSGDLFIMPFALSVGTVALAILMVLVTAAVSALFVSDRLNRLDLVGVLKTRE